MSEAANEGVAPPRLCSGYCSRRMGQQGARTFSAAASFTALARATKSAASASEPGSGRRPCESGVGGGVRR